MTTPNALEASYLKHILIAAEVRDYSAPFRTFFDSWFAFKEGGPFLNANSRPHWHNNPCPDKHGKALRRAHFVSVAAARTLGGLERERLMKDHAIPVSIVRDMLFENEPKSIDEIRAFLLRCYRFGIITTTEDNALNRAGLRSKMPPGWTHGDSPFARYDEVGIIAQDHGQFGAAIQVTAPPIRAKMLAPIRNLLSSVATGITHEGPQGCK